MTSIYELLDFEQGFVRSYSSAFTITLNMVQPAVALGYDSHDHESSESNLLITSHIHTDFHPYKIIHENTTIVTS